MNEIGIPSNFKWRTFASIVTERRKKNGFSIPLSSSLLIGNESERPNASGRFSWKWNKEDKFILEFHLYFSRINIQIFLIYNPFVIYNRWVIGNWTIPWHGLRHRCETNLMFNSMSFWLQKPGEPPQRHRLWAKRPFLLHYSYRG